MTVNWTPAAILPNLAAKRAIEGEVIALVPCSDPRIQAFCAAHAKFNELISRFTDAFRVPLDPVVLIIRDDVVGKLAKVEPLASFRDLVALSVVPYARSLGLVHGNGHRISYSDSFWFHPWMLGTDNEHLVASTPAIHGFHVVEQFHGQSSPELLVMELTDLDKPLFEALLALWTRHYLSKRQRWRDRALFRSLNMAANAAQLPAGIDVTLYDLGRAVALWVSAFEILAHPRTSNSGLSSVYPLLESVSYLDRNVGRRRYAAYMGRTKKPPRRSLPCWIYGKLYQARNAFLHGSPVGIGLLNPPGSKVGLFWIAPSLYRLALTGFLELRFRGKRRLGKNLETANEYALSRIRFERYQATIERALLRTRK